MKAPVPIFATPPSGTLAQRYLHRARMFRDASVQLVGYTNGEQNLPRYALLTHSIELSLKAFALHSVPAEIKRPAHHDLNGWYQLAVKYGLPNDLIVEENVNHLHQLHLTHYTRYPPDQEPVSPVPDLSIADRIVDHLIDRLLTPIINPR